MTTAATAEETPVTITRPSYFPVAKRSIAVGPDSRDALRGPTRILPIPCKNTNMAKVANTVEGSLLTARPMATRIVPKPKPKKPYVRLKRINMVVDLARPQSVREDTAAATQHSAARKFTDKFLSDKYPKTNCPKTCAIDMRDSKSAPFFDEVPRPVAYDGKKMGGKKKPSPWMRVAEA
jgi:hypothetical protein